jgi:hypothetical protein
VIAGPSVALLKESLLELERLVTEAARAVALAMEGGGGPEEALALRPCANWDNVQQVSKDFIPSSTAYTWELCVAMESS